VTEKGEKRERREKVREKVREKRIKIKESLQLHQHQEKTY
jgi:hypothetical protein